MLDSLQVNGGEVSYTIAKVEGFAETARIMNRVRLLPLAELDAGEEVTATAQFKGGHGFLTPIVLRPLPPPKTRFWRPQRPRTSRRSRGLRILPLPEHKGTHPP